MGDGGLKIQKKTQSGFYQRRSVMANKVAHIFEIGITRAMHDIHYTDYLKIGFHSFISNGIALFKKYERKGLVVHFVYSVEVSHISFQYMTPFINYDLVGRQIRAGHFWNSSVHFARWAHMSFSVCLSI